MSRTASNANVLGFFHRLLLLSTFQHTHAHILDTFAVGHISIILKAAPANVRPLCYTR